MGRDSAKEPGKGEKSGNKPRAGISGLLKRIQGGRADKPERKSKKPVACSVAAASNPSLPAAAAPKKGTGLAGRKRKRSGAADLTRLNGICEGGSLGIANGSPGGGDGGSTTPSSGSSSAVFYVGQQVMYEPLGRAAEVVRLPDNGSGKVVIEFHGGSTRIVPAGKLKPQPTFSETPAPATQPPLSKRAKRT